MLTFQALIVALIQAEVAGFTTVGNASLPAGLRDIGPLLPGCFVIPGAAEPIQQTAQQASATLEIQEWHVIVIVPHQHTDSADGLTETVAGGLLNNVMKALQGQRVDARQRQGFVYQGRGEPVYSAGYAEFPITFAAQVVVGI